MNPEPSVPDEPPAPEPAAAPKAAGPVPASVLILGFVVVVLLGVLVAVSLRPKGGSGNPASAEGDSAIRDLKGRLQAQQESLNQERVKLGLTPLYSGNGQEPAEVVAKRITEDAATLAGLSKGVMDLIADKDAERARTAKELSDALQLQTILRDKNDALQKERDQAMLDASTAMLARRDLDKANATIGLLQKELERLGKGPADMQSRLAAITQERDSLLARIKQLEVRLSESALFANSEAQLMKEAVALFRSLRELEGKPDSAISTAYSQFGAKMGANVMDQPISFPTGSYEVATADIDKISSFIAGAPDNAFFFVVGYASETGNVDSNRVLSSDRATAVAKVVNQVKKSGQQVQAAYLGQTDRFGSHDPERNQICEVWQIIPRTASSPQSLQVPPPPAPGE